MHRAFSALRRAFRRGRAADSGLAYWEERARRHGVRSVMHLGHPESDLPAVTRAQRERLLPLLASRLRGDEKVVLDFGCGPGRFTKDLAGLVGHAVGVDPIARLLDLAPASEDVDYRLMHTDRIPIANAGADVAWVCLVLGGLDDAELDAAEEELRRVLAPGGLLFLVENTSHRTDAPHWRFRSVRAYRDLFAWVDLQHLGDYDDLGERISILAGRRPEEG